MITPGLYRTRSGPPVQVIVKGNFAHTASGSSWPQSDMWHIEDGKYVPNQSKSQRNGQPIAGPHRLDLVERIGVLK